jgi:CheY-like chemotaxis protein
MKPTRCVLIADDDSFTRELWDRDIAEFNADTSAPSAFVAVFAKNREEAVGILERTRINCAAVDLRMPVGTGKPAAAQTTAAAGNDILERLLVEVGVPTVVYSGYPQEASERVKQSPIKVMLKTGGGAMEALRWLANHEPLMSAMEASARKISSESARLFNKSIWPRWATTWRPDDRHLTNVITRQIAAHLAETLGVPETDFHPEEFYHIPSLNERLDTGDLVDYQDQTLVVVTPRCNLARSYPTNIMLAPCRAVGEDWTNIIAKLKSGDHKKIGSAERKLRDFATQGHATSTHFLPICGARGPWLVDFKEAMSVISTEVPELLRSRFASISPSFVPNLVQRYAAYLGRIGQPDLDCAVLRELIMR